MKFLPAEKGEVALGVQWPVERYSSASLDQLRGRSDHCVGQPVESAELVVWSVAMVGQWVDLGGDEVVMAYRPQAL